MRLGFFNLPLFKVKKSNHPSQCERYDLMCQMHYIDGIFYMLPIECLYTINK